MNKPARAGLFQGQALQTSAEWPATADFGFRLLHAGGDKSAIKPGDKIT
jgi:hypothetical protein